MSGIKIVFVKEEYDQFSNTSLDKIKSTNKSLYDNLINAGFIIGDSIDGFSQLIHRHNNNVFYNNNIYKMTVLPTMSCNFKCWYCYEKHPKSTFSTETYKKLLRYIDYVFDNYPFFAFNLDWFGGEPLLRFKEMVYPVSLYVKEKVLLRGMRFINTITTNGYCINDDVVRKFAEIDLDGFQITLDGYKPIHDTIRYPSKNKGSYDTIIYNINKICSTLPNAKVNLRINYTNDTFGNLRNIIDDIAPSNRNKIQITLQRVWQTISNENDKEEEIAKEVDFFKKAGLVVVHNTYKYGSGCICYADSMRQSVVNYDGMLFKCTARDFTNKDFSVGYLSNEGEPIWNSGYYDRFLRAPFDNPVCKDCEYVPVCLGVCSQKYIDEHGDFLRKYCNKESCKMTIEDDLYDSLYDYIEAQIH